MIRPYDWHGMHRGDTPFAILQHTLSGHGRLTLSGGRTIGRAGRDHARDRAAQSPLLGENGDDWEFFWIVMYGEEAVKVHQSVIDVRRALVHLSNDGIGKIARCCLALIEGEGSRPGALPLWPIR